MILENRQVGWEILLVAYLLSVSPPDRLSCRDQEGRRGSEEAVPGPSVLPSREPGVSGD